MLENLEFGTPNGNRISVCTTNGHLQRTSKRFYGRQCGWSKTPADDSENDEDEDGDNADDAQLQELPHKGWNYARTLGIASFEKKTLQIYHLAFSI